MSLGHRCLIDGHSYLSGGNINVNTGSGGAGPTANFEAYDSSFNNSVSTNLLVNSSNAKILRNAINGAGTGIVTRIAFVMNSALASWHEVMGT